MFSQETSSPTRILCVWKYGMTKPWVYACLACFLLTALLACRQNWDPDLGYHLKGGQWIIQNHRVPTTDTYTYTVPDHEYLDMHWLYQVLVYLLYLSGGYSLISFINIILILIAFGIAWIRLQQTQCPLWISSILLAWAIFACEFRFHIRPEIVTWSLTGTVLWVLDERRARGRNFLWMLLIIHLLWVDIEGLFPLGWIVIGIYLVSGLIHNRRFDIPMAYYGLGSVAITFINPYGIRAVLHPLTLLNTLQNKVFTKNINELLSPWAGYNPGVAQDPFLTYKCFAVFLFLLILFSLKHLKTHDLIVSVFFFGLSFSNSRNIPLFMLVCIPTAGSYWKNLDWPPLRKFQNQYLSSPVTALIITLFLLGLASRIPTNSFYFGENRQEHFGFGIDEERLPVHAAEFLVQNRLEGRIINELGCGDWLDWRGTQKVFIDGRSEVIGPDLFLQYADSRQGENILHLADRYQGDIIFFTLPHQWASAFQKSAEWRAVYLDGTAAVYLRRGYAPQIPSIEDAQLLEKEGIPADIQSQAPALLKLPPPSPWQTFLEGFYQRSVYPVRLARMGVFLFLNGHPQAGEAFYLEAIRRSQGNIGIFYFNLGQFYFLLKRYPEAGLCMKRVLADDPNNTAARQILDNIPHI